MKSKILILLGLCLSLTASSLYSQQNTHWIGDGSNTNWFDDNNWDNGSHPLSSDNVYIQNSEGPILTSWQLIESENSVYNSNSSFGISGGAVTFKRFELINNSRGNFDGGFFYNHEYFNITHGSSLFMAGNSFVFSKFIDMYGGGSILGVNDSTLEFYIAHSYSSTIHVADDSYVSGYAWNVSGSNMSISSSRINLTDLAFIDSSYIQLYNHGIIHVETLDASSNGTLYMDLTSFIEVDYQMTLGGSLFIDTYGMSFVEGDSFTLFEAGTIVGTFDDVYISGTLAEGLSWNLDNLYINGSISVIPEPSTYALIFGSLALALAVYRRRK